MGRNDRHFQPFFSIFKNQVRLWCSPAQKMLQKHLHGVGMSLAKLLNVIILILFTIGAALLLARASDEAQRSRIGDQTGGRACLQERAP